MVFGSLLPQPLSVLFAKMPLSVNGIHTITGNNSITQQCSEVRNNIISSQHKLQTSFYCCDLLSFQLFTFALSDDISIPFPHRRQEYRRILELINSIFAYIVLRKITKNNKKL